MSVTTAGRAEIELSISGMTCASCAARIEKKLNRMDGVAATVNFATEKARVAVGPGVGVADLIATVERTGYTARVPEPPRPRAGAAGEAGEPDGLRRRLLITAALSVPVIIVSMVPALQFRDWAWLAFALTIPVVAYGGWPFHRAAWAGLRHGAATMDTLVSLGTLAAFGWSAWALPLGRTMYLETAAGVTTFILLGRYLEARARRRAGSALRALLELGARDVTVLRDGREERVPVAQLTVGDRFVVRPGEKIATDGTVVEGSSAVDAAHADRRVGAGRGRPGRPGHRRHGERRRPAGGRGDQRRRGHPAGPDGPPGRAGPARQGRRPAAGRPDLRGVRARGDRHRPAHPGRLAGHRRQPGRGVHRRGRGADHRLPVRPGPGHAHRADGRHRARRPAGHPDQGPGGAGVDPRRSTPWCWTRPAPSPPAP